MYVWLGAIHYVTGCHVLQGWVSYITRLGVIYYEAGCHAMSTVGALRTLAAGVRDHLSRALESSKSTRAEAHNQAGKWLPSAAPQLVHSWKQVDAYACARAGAAQPGGQVAVQ